LGVTVDLRYSGGKQDYLHTVNAVLRLRRELVAEPAILRMPAFGEGSNVTAGSVVLRQYASPGKPFAAVDPIEVIGPLSVVRETEWETRAEEGSLSVREKTLLIELSKDRAESVSPATGIVRASAQSVYWSNEAEVRVFWEPQTDLWLQPASAILSPSRPTATFHVTGIDEDASIISVDAPEWLSWRIANGSDSPPAVEVSFNREHPPERAGTIAELVVTTENGNSTRRIRGRVLAIGRDKSDY
jgi:hypothetical protein